MTTTGNQQTGEGEMFARKSSLYQEFLAERDEILKHKWIESQKAGYDIGFEKALLDWIRNHRDVWKENRHKAPKNESQQL
ncbi:MAG: hypothetical protein CMI18_12440 [Opitutaceae bacterium]|nr:hypothetical protein [Opitutaceae bacterium]